MIQVIADGCRLAIFYEWPRGSAIGEPILLEAAFDEEHHRGAERAFDRFGKGRHPALNMGDYFSYDVARIAEAPLLYKGQDFRKTDVKRPM